MQAIWPVLAPDAVNPEALVLQHAPAQHLGAQAGDTARLAAEMRLVGIARAGGQIGPIHAARSHRIKAWTGQTLRQLQGRSRAEAVFFQARDAVAAGNVDWADLAAGSGAMSLRLADAGYRVTATDYVAENFRLSEQIPFFAADLNDHFSAGREGVFDIVFASEIIEHLENPRHFARQCFKLLKPGGKVILSTPNVDTAPSVARFLRSGHYQWFDEENYRDDGHITPLSQGQIDKCFTEAGFAINWKGSFGERTMLLRGSPRMMLMSFLLDKLMPLNDSLKQQIFVAVLQKPATAHS